MSESNDFQQIQKLSLEQIQTQRATQNQILLGELIAMNDEGIKERIEAELYDNPALEEVNDEQEESYTDSVEDGDGDDNDRETTQEVGQGDEDPFESPYAQSDDDSDSSGDSYDDGFALIASSRRKRADDVYRPPVVNEASMYEVLMNQVRERDLTERQLLIAEYMEQRIGIIVEQVQQYVSLVVKPLPKAFKNFSILQGIVFDEHYDIVPILHVPDILKKFKSLRGYDIKKYEAATKKRNIWILVVDDSDTTRHIEKSILENGGFSVDTATDGIDALESLKRKQYDLVLTDKDMPRMNGLVLIDNIRRMEQYKTVPVIVVSADQNPEIKAQFERSGANAFIAKGDFKRGNLISAVQELVR